MFLGIRAGARDSLEPAFVGPEVVRELEKEVSCRGIRERIGCSVEAAVRRSLRKEVMQEVSSCRG